MSAAHRRGKINRGWGDDLPSIPVTKIDAELYGALREVEGDQLVMQDGKIRMGAFTLTGTGLQVENGSTQEEWQQVGDLLFRLEGSIQWLIGDWLAYGANFGYGDVKQLAIDMGREPGTFWEYAYVCRSVATWVRTQDLSYGHHKLVAALAPDDQVAALAYAVKNNLSVANFRKWLRGDDQQAALSAGESSDPLPLLKKAWGISKKDIASISTRDLKTAVEDLNTVIQMAVQERERMISEVEKRGRK